MELLLLIGIVLSGVAAGAQADKVKANTINEKIIVFFIRMFPLKVGIATKYKEFPTS